MIVGKTMSRWVLLVGLIGGVPLAAIAAPESDLMEVPVIVDPQLEELSFYARAWQCVLSEAKDSTITTIPFQWSVKRELKDLWFFGEASTAEKGLFMRENLGYNTIMQKFGRTVIGDDGTFGNFLSSGWEEDTLLWEGRVSNLVTKQVEKRRILMLKISEDRFIEGEERAVVTDGEPSWTLVSAKQCVAQ